MKLLKFAAIDIGTNAIRLLFTNVIENDDSVILKKSSIIRVPVRLGGDVFTTGRISDLKKQKLIETMKAFKHLMSVQDVIQYRACATSAMREAGNGKDIVRSIKRKVGINIEIIDGKTEAEIIFNNRSEYFNEIGTPYLFLDIGGGSTEFSLFYNNEVLESISYNIGTIRYLNEAIDAKEFNKMKLWLMEIKSKYPDLIIIGSGGNINKLLKISGRKEGKVLPVKVLKNVYNYINSFNYEDRIKVLGLNPDRADVIIPASDLLFKIVKWTGTKEIIVPKVGVADGIIKQLYKDYQIKQNN